MSIRIIALAIPVAFILACSGDGPTQMDDSTLQVQAPLLGQMASGAVPGSPDDFDLAAYDANEDDKVCIKTVPEGEGNADTRTIIKDNKNGECPGGFEEVELLPLCTGEFGVVGECQCPEGWVTRPEGDFCFNAGQ